MNKNIFKQNNLEFNMLDKRGQGLSTNAIILIILGVVILVVMILGFTLGWDKIAPFLQTNNVENIKTSCGVACTTGDTYGFCAQERTLKADGLPLDEDGKAQKKIDGNCSFFSDETNTDYIKYGIEECGSITCP